MIYLLRKPASLSLLAAAIAFACSDDDDNGNKTPLEDGGAGGSDSDGGDGAAGKGDGGDAGDAGGCAFTVCPSDDDVEGIQGALSSAATGDTITLGPGTYTLTKNLTLSSASDITVKGGGDDRDGVVLDFTDQADGSEGLLVTTDGFTIENLSIKNTTGNGIKVQAKNSVFRNIKVGWDEVKTSNGAYAIYPTECDTTLMEDNEVYGAADAGIYAGQCTHVIARRNKAHDNVLGIEIENTTDAEVYDNEVYDNTCGLLLDLLPNLQKKDQKNYLVHDNMVRNNNTPNFAEPNTVAAVMPEGTGILVLAASDIEITKNTIKDHTGAAVTIVSYDIVDLLSTDPAARDPETNRWPSRIYVHENTYENNGTAPKSSYELIAVDSDGGKALPFHVIWDGALPPGGGDAGADAGATAESAQICLGEPEQDAFMNFNLPTLLTAPSFSFDTTPHQCTLPAIPPL